MATVQKASNSLLESFIDAFRLGSLLPTSPADDSDSDIVSQEKLNIINLNNIIITVQEYQSLLTVADARIASLETDNAALKKEQTSVQSFASADTSFDSESTDMYALPQLVNFRYRNASRDTQEIISLKDLNQSLEMQCTLEKHLSMSYFSELCVLRAERVENVDAVSRLAVLRETTDANSSSNTTVESSSKKPNLIRRARGIKDSACDIASLDNRLSLIYRDSTLDRENEGMEILKQQMSNREAEMEADIRRYESYIDELQRNLDRADNVAATLAAALQRENTAYSRAKNVSIELPRDDTFETRYHQSILESHLALSYFNDLHLLKNNVLPKAESARDILPEMMEALIESEKGDLDSEDELDSEEILQEIDEAYAQNRKLHERIMQLNSAAHSTISELEVKYAQSVIDHQLLFSYANEPLEQVFNEGQVESQSDDRLMVLTVEKGSSDLSADTRDIEYEYAMMEYEARIDELIRGNQCVTAFYQQTVTALKMCQEEIAELKLGNPANVVASRTISDDVDPETIYHQAILDEHLRFSYRNDYQASLIEEISRERAASRSLSSELLNSARKSEEQILQLLDEIEHSEAQKDDLHERVQLLHKHAIEALVNREQAIVDCHLALSYVNDLDLEIPSSYGESDRERELSTNLIDSAHKSQEQIMDLLEELETVEFEKGQLQSYVGLLTRELDSSSTRYHQAVLDNHLALSYASEEGVESRLKLSNNGSAIPSRKDDRYVTSDRRELLFCEASSSEVDVAVAATKPIAPHFAEQSLESTGNQPGTLGTDSDRVWQKYTAVDDRRDSGIYREKYERLVLDYNRLVSSSQNTVSIDTFEKLMEVLEDKSEKILMNEQLLLSYQQDIANLKAELAKKTDDEEDAPTMARRSSENREIGRLIQGRERELEEMRKEHEALIASELQSSPMPIQRQLQEEEASKSLQLGAESAIPVSPGELAILRRDAEKVSGLEKSLKEAEARLRARDLYLNNRYKFCSNSPILASWIPPSAWQIWKADLPNSRK